MKNKIIMTLLILSLITPITYATNANQINYDQQLNVFTGVIVTMDGERALLLQDIHTNQQAYLTLTDETTYKKEVNDTFVVGNYVTAKYDEVLLDNIILQFEADVIIYNDTTPPEIDYPIISGKITDAEEGILHINNQIFNKQLIVIYDTDTTYETDIPTTFSVDHYVSFQIDEIDYTNSPITVTASHFIYNDAKPPATDRQYLAVGVNSIFYYYHPDQYTPLNYTFINASDDSRSIDFYNTHSNEIRYHVTLDSTNFTPTIITYYPQDSGENEDPITQYNAQQIAKKFIKETPINHSMLDLFYSSTAYSEDYSSILAYYYICTYMSNHGQITSCTIKVDAHHKTVTNIYGPLPL